MPVNGVTMPKLDWTSAIDALNSMKGVSAVKEEGSIRISHTDGKGVTTSITLDAPELDAPESFSTAELENFVANFGDLSASNLFPNDPAGQKQFLDTIKGSLELVAKEKPELLDGFLGFGSKAPASPKKGPTLLGGKKTGPTTGPGNDGDVNGPQGGNPTNKNNNVGGPSRGASKALFDVYGILKLMLLVAQLQRNSLRLVRQAENAAVQKSILDQAGEMRSAALAGLIGSLVVGVIQIGLQYKTLKDFGKSFTQQMTIKNASGVPTAKMNLETAKLAGNPEAATANLKRLGDAAPDKATIDSELTRSPELEKVTELGGKVDQSLAKTRGEVASKQEAVKQYKEVSNELGSVDGLKEQKIQLETKLKGLDSKQNPAEYEQCQKDIKDIDGKIQLKELLDGKEGQPGKIAKLEGEIAEKQKILDAKYDELPQEQKELVDKFSEAREAYRGKVDATEAGYKRKFETARSNYREAIKGGDETEIAKTKQEFEAAKANYEYAHGAAMEAKINHGGVSRMDMSERAMLEGQRDLQSAQNDLQTDDAYQILDEQRAKLRVYDGMIQAGGQALQNVSNQVSQAMQAEAHKYGASEQEARNELDQITDLFTNCQKLLETVLQAVQAVIQAESRSVDETIQGLRG